MAVYPMYYLDQMFVDVFSDWNEDLVSILTDEDKVELLTMIAKYGKSISDQHNPHETTLRVVLRARKRLREETPCEPANG